MLSTKKLFSFSTIKFNLISLGSLAPGNSNIPTPRTILLRGPQLLHGKLQRYLCEKVSGTSGQVPQIVDLQYLIADNRIYDNVSSNPIFILHGLLGCKENWQTVAKQLNFRLGRAVYAFDFRNHGSSPHTLGFSYSSMAFDLVYFMRTREIERATMIGHSMGGRVAMLLAMRYPDLVQSMIIVDISPFGASPKMQGMAKLMRDIKNLLLNRHYTLKEARKQTAAQLREKNYDEKVINFLLHNMVENEWHTNWKWKFNLEPIMMNYEKEILTFPPIEKPCRARTLFLAGAESDYVNPEDEASIKEKFPRAEFTYIKGAGHWVHVDNPSEFIETVVEFIDKDPNKLQEEAEKKPLGRPVDLAFHKYDGHIHEMRSKVPVIILHGLLGSKQNWNSMAGLMHKKCGRVIYALDARNHGDSPHAEVFTYDIMIGDLLVFLKKHNMKQVSIVGHSMGGRVAMLMAMLYPDLVHSMVVVDMSPGRAAGLSGVRQLLHDLHDLYIDPLLPAREARNQAAARLREKVKDERIIAFILMNLVDNTKSGDVPGVTNRKCWTWKFNLDSIVKFFDSEIADFPIVQKDVNVRALFVGGVDSDFIKPSDEKHILELFPLSEFVYIEGAGHWVHAEKPQQFLEIVSKFLIRDC